MLFGNFKNYHILRYDIYEFLKKVSGGLWPSRLVWTFCGLVWHFLPTPDLLGGCCEGPGMLTLGKAGNPRVGGYSSREEEGLCQGTGKTVVSAEERTRPQHRAGKEPQEGEGQTGLEDQIYQDIICLNTCCILYIFNTVIKVSRRTLWCSVPPLGGASLRFGRTARFQARSQPCTLAEDL